MNISYVNSNKTTSLPVELDALNNKDISYDKDFFLYIETQLKIAKDFLDLEKKYQVLLQVKF
ncbi:protein YjbS, partial [Klebsiella pneumoniae]|uniref:protein YjbS n=1 Tax=Klebsiella pneumoniae TaxID=573 RepID=UPI0010100F45